MGLTRTAGVGRRVFGFSPGWYSYILMENSGRSIRVRKRIFARTEQNRECFRADFPAAGVTNIRRPVSALAK